MRIIDKKKNDKSAKYHQWQGNGCSEKHYEKTFVD